MVRVLEIVSLVLFLQTAVVTASFIPVNYGRASACRGGRESFDTGGLILLLTFCTDECFRRYCCFGQTTCCLSNTSGCKNSGFTVSFIAILTRAIIQAVLFDTLVRSQGCRLVPVT